MTAFAVTGASGFIGRQLVRRIEADGHSVLVLVRPKNENGDWAIPAGIDVLVHLAGRAHVQLEDSGDPHRAFLDANLVLTQSVAHSAEQAGVSRFVYMSSALVLGNVSPPGGFSEDAPARPYDAYSRSKSAAEDWIRSQSFRALQPVVIRPPLVYGPGARGNFARILRAVVAGWPLPLGSLRAPRSMVGLRNLTDLIMKASLDPGAANKTMMVADAETTNIAELASTLATLTDRRLRLFRVPVPLLNAVLQATGRSADIARLTQPFVLNAHRATELLGWRPPFSMLDELRWTIQQDARSS